MYIDIIVSIALVVIIGAAIAYIIRAKKRGVKCVGCPHGKQCGGNCGGKCETDK